MKKIVLLVLMLSAFCLPSKGQNQIEDMIVDCIQSNIDYLSPYLDSSEIYICKDGLPLDFSYDRLPDAVFYSVNNIRSSPNSLKKKLKKGVWTYFVKFDFVDNQFKVTVLYRKVTLGKKVTAILISSWAYFFYEYSAENNRWELRKTEYGGV
jgi:hypothetical protein